MHPTLTARSVIAGLILAVVLCAANSYLVLSFGIMEEGPAIAALFFFAMFCLSRQKITTNEMVIVATMGSAGGSLGFLANFFAAQVMIVDAQGGTYYSFGQMVAFGLVTSLVGLVSAIIFRQILVVQNERLPEKERLPWVGAKAVQGVIDPLVAHGDRRQALYLMLFTVGAILFVIVKDGYGAIPTLIPLGGLAAFSGGIYLAPLLWGAPAYFGARTTIGFLVGGIILLFIAQGLPGADAERPYMPHNGRPDTFVWPGIMFLITSGLMALLIRWRTIVDAVKSLFSMGSDDPDPIMSRSATKWTIVLVCLFAIGVMWLGFGLALRVVLAMLVVGGLVLNMISNRAAAQTYFNPARIMGVLLMGVTALVGGTSAQTCLTGAGFIAGSGSQSGNLTNDFAYGLWYRIRSAVQFWTQSVTAIICTIVAALTFILIRENFAFAYPGDTGLPAPVAKIWAIMAMFFDPNANLELPPFAVEAMWIGGIVGIIYALVEHTDVGKKILPGSIGLGIGLILPVFYDFGFVFGGILMLFILPKIFRVSSQTIQTIAIACIVGEGFGGIITALLNTLGIIGGGGH